MKLNKLRTVQIILLAIAVIACAFVLYRPQRHDDPNTFNWHNLPKEGYAYNDTHGEVPGDMENGVKGLNKLYGDIQIFRTRHDGKYPKNNREMMADCMRSPRAYGYATYEQHEDAFLNPDNKYGDTTHDNPDKINPYSIMGVRGDGSPVGGPKPAGAHDLIGGTNLYVHQNIRLFNHEKSTENPVGAYLLLWDNGSVTKLPYNQILMAQVGQNHYKIRFPGQVGLPTTGVITYDQFYSHKNGGPRGAANRPGVSAAN